MKIKKYRIKVKENTAIIEFIIPTLIWLILNITTGYWLFDYLGECDMSGVTLMIVAIVNVDISYMYWMVDKFNFYEDSGVGLDEKKE